MRKFLTLLALCFIVVSGAHAQAIYGALGACVGNTRVLYVDTMAPTSGTWSSSTPSVATIGATTGVVTAVSVGTSTITYTGSAGVLTAVFTVSAPPAAIVGGGVSLCVGSTVSLSNPTPGGTWSSSAPSRATVGVTGVVTGVNPGTATIFYSSGPGCAASTVVTVAGAPAIDSVMGPYYVCVGSTGTFWSPTGGGSWSVSPSSIASITSAGVLTGISAGTATVTYSVTATCGSSTGTTEVTIVGSGSAGTLSGPSTVDVGSTIHLTSTVMGGTWSSSTPSVATVSFGYVTGVSGGTATITYTAGCGGSAIATKVVTVVPFGGISGNVLFGAGSYTGSVKVWLIKYNPATLMLTACDSTTVYSSGSGAYYQFAYPATDSYRVKAHVEDSAASPAIAGYIPTYHTSAFYWSAASVINHTAGVADINKNINMAFGTASSGPGFIAGNVMSGANKGTATSVPAVGLLIYAVNPATGNVIQHTYTDASGNYSFSNLPVGQTYRIYPELINYETTPFPLITLTSGTTSMTAANFEQRTVSHKIVPIVTGVSPLTIAAPSMYVYPNPSVNQVNIEVNAAQPENGTLVITDVMGREQYRQDVQSNGHFAQTLDVTRFAAGVYFISYDAGTSHYKQTISIKH